MALPEADRVLLARIAGTAACLARQRLLTAGEREAAVARLNAAAAGRADLLAAHAGVTAGSHEGDPGEDWYLREAQLRLDAGADTRLVPQWIEEGRRRATAPQL